MVAFSGQPVDPGHAKLDKELLDFEDIDSRPIFVRMTDQLISRAGDYEKFCQKHRHRKRAELRPFVIQTLRQKSDASWKKIAPDVDQLVKDGQIKKVQRFWIVNGFACDATAKACERLAASPSVSFIYLQHMEGRGCFLDHEHAGQAPEPATEEQKELYERVLKEWKDDSDEPFSTAGLEIPWNLHLIQADTVWEQEKVTGRGVVVAVFDSGLLTVPSLVRALWKNPKEKLDGKDGDGNGYVDDLFGYDFEANSFFALGDSTTHGTACASIIAGRSINSKNLITGVAPRSRLMILRGGGRLRAYEYALANGADVFSMSYSLNDIGHYRGVHRAAHEHLAAAGIVSCCVAGNHGDEWPAGEQIISPGDIPCVITTAGIRKDGEKAAFSSEGPCSWQDVHFYNDYREPKLLQKPDVSAPVGGFPVWASPQIGEVVSDEGDGTALVMAPPGTSMSCPHSAGVAALILSANPDLNAWEVKEIMEQTCKDLGPKGRDTSFGAGLLHALDAVRAAKKMKKNDRGRSGRMQQTTIWTLEVLPLYQMVEAEVSCK